MNDESLFDGCCLISVQTVLSKIQSESHLPLSESPSPSLGRSIPLMDWLLLFRIMRPNLGAPPPLPPWWDEWVFEPPPSLSEYLLLALLLPSSSTGRVWYLAEVRGALRRMGVSLNRMEGTGLGVVWGLDREEGAYGGGVWLREVELLRLVLRFSRGMEDGRSAEEVVEVEEGGRGEEMGRFSGVAEVLEQAEPGLLGAGFRFGLVSELLVGDETPAWALSSPTFSRSSAAAVGLRAAQGWLKSDVAVEQSGREESDDWVIVSLPPPPPPLFFEPPERSSNPIEPCFEALGVTVQAWDCCPLVWECTLVIDIETPFPPSPGLHTCKNG